MDNNIKVEINNIYMSNHINIGSHEIEFEYKNGYYADVYPVLLDNNKKIGYYYKDSETNKQWFDIFSNDAPNSKDLNIICNEKRLIIKSSENGYYAHTIEEVEILYTVMDLLSLTI